MPFINVIVSAQPDAALSARIAGEVANLTHRILGKDPAVTAVAVSCIGPQHWFAGGRSLAATGMTSFWLDIKITEATNTKAEIAEFIDAIYGTLAGLLSKTGGPVHPESYALVDAVPAHAYGFGGRTQEHRFITARPGKT